MKISLLNMFAQKIHFGYRGGSNEYSQCIFLINNKKIRYSPANPNCSI